MALRVVRNWRRERGAATAARSRENSAAIARSWPNGIATYSLNAKAIGHDGAWDAERESRGATSGRHGLRLVIASDTHEQHAQLVVPDGDVFIHCGDFTYNGDLKAIAAFGAWLAVLPHQHKLVIAGNHDFAFERLPAPARKALGSDKNGVRYLQDSGVTINGVSFWGSPWQPWI